MPNSVHWCGHVLRTEYAHVLWNALGLRLKVRGREGGQNNVEEAGCGRKYEGWLEKGRCTLSINVECWH